MFYSYSVFVICYDIFYYSFLQRHMERLESENDELLNTVGNLTNLVNEFEQSMKGLLRSSIENTDTAIPVVKGSEESLASQVWV